MDQAAYLESLQRVLEDLDEQIISLQTRRQRIESAIDTLTASPDLLTAISDLLDLGLLAE